jgi:predicted Zn-dependent protease
MNYSFDISLEPNAAAHWVRPRIGTGDFWSLFLNFSNETFKNIIRLFPQEMPLGHFSVRGRIRVREFDGALLFGIVATLKIRTKVAVWQWENIIEEAPGQAKIAAEQLAFEMSKSFKAMALTKRTVTDLILTPWPASLFVHEVVGHMAEADNLLSLDNPIISGTPVASLPLTIVDDPTLAGTRTLFTKDDEGYEAHPVQLIADGIWNGVLASADSIKQLPFGYMIGMRGRRSTARGRILPRQSNTFLLPQVALQLELIRKVRDGFLVFGGNGGGSADTRFFICPVVAQRIRDGILLDEFVSDFVLGGDKLHALRAIVAVGSDFKMFSPFFGCDKEGENQLPICHGSPSVLMRQVSLYPKQNLLI